jgi:uncharacterized membrane protein YbhN (UPF0104 family)
MLVLTFTAAGAPAPLAVAAVVLYRVVAHGHVVLFGWLAIAARSRRKLPLRDHPGR